MSYQGTDSTRQGSTEASDAAEAPGDGSAVEGGSRHGLSRKEFLGGSVGMGALVLSGGWLAPGPVRPGRARPLAAGQTATLEAWCELLVPGAAAGDVGRFVNDQLALPHAEAKLMLRFVSWPPPYVDFYRSGLAALDGASRELFGGRFVALATDQQTTVRDRVLAGTVAWSAPPAGLFYFVTRGDAVDVVYGTVEGFARIDYPYQALVAPRRRW